MILEQWALRKPLCYFIALVLSGSAYADSFIEVTDADARMESGEVVDARQSNQQAPKKSQPVQTKESKSSAPVGCKQKTNKKEMNKGQCTPEKAVCGEPLPLCAPCYNLASGIDVKNCWGVDIYTTASFIYWMANMDGFEFAQYPNGYPFAAVADTTSTLFQVGPQGNGSIQVHESKFKPGFKVGLGLNTHFDNWAVYAEYTWLHQSTKQGYHLTDPNNRFLLGNLTTSPQGAVPALIGGSLHTKWHLRLDLLDANVSRSYYVGQRVTLEPSFGLKAAWIEQTFHINLGALPGAGLAVPVAFSGLPALRSTDQIRIRMKEQSWALGPRIGLKGQWLPGGGFRIDGKAFTSLLYTSYTELSFHRVTPISAFVYNTAGTANQIPFINLREEDHGAMRPNAELGLGFGWGSYIYDHRFHLDFSAAYDLQVFWSQSLLRSLYDATVYQSANDPRDLTLQGLTLTMRFDF